MDALRLESVLEAVSAGAAAALHRRARTRAGLLCTGWGVCGR